MRPGTFYNILTHCYWTSHNMCSFGPFGTNIPSDLFGDSHVHVQSRGLKYVDIASQLPCLGSGL